MSAWARSALLGGLASAALCFAPAAGAVTLQRDDQQAGNEPYDVSLADLDLDGLPDLITANRNASFTTGNVTVRLGSLTQGYTMGQTFTVNQDVTKLAVGEVTGDSNRDVVTSNFFSDSVSVLSGNGSGGLGAPTNLPAGSRPTGVVLEDVNGDTRRDILVSDQGATTGTAGVSVLLANTTGGFSAATSFAAGTAPTAIAAGDYTGDGKVDIVAANGGFADSVSVLPGNGAGAFGAPVAYPAGRAPSSLAGGDFNGDGRPDLAVGNTGGGGTANPGPAGVSVLLADGAGGFRAPVTYERGTVIGDVAAGDLDGDSRPDLALVSLTSNQLFVLRGRADGTFVDALTSATGGSPDAVAIGEMMPTDGKADVAVANRADDSVGRYLNTGAPTFSVSPSAVNFGPRPVGQFSEVRTVTVRNDGHYALLVSNASATGPSEFEYFVNGNDCTGTPVPPGETCEITVRFQAAAAGSRPATLRIFHGAAGSPSDVPLSGSGTPPDTQAPQTSVGGGPAALTADPTPTFRFASSEAGSRYRCRIFRPGAPAPALGACPNPFTSPRLADGAWVLEVVAVDGANNADASPAARRFTVDTRAPESAITAGPGGLTGDATPSFSFASEPGARFTCSVDGAAFSPCASGASLAPLADGSHELRFRAFDRAGNGDPSPAARRFTVDASAPGLAISRRSVRMRRRALRVRLRCSAAERSGPCVGRLTLKVGRRRIGSARYSISAGATKIVRVRLSRRARRLLIRRRRVRVRASTRVSDRVPNTRSVSRRIVARR